MMAANTSRFPAFVSLEYEKNGSMLPAMKKDIDASFSEAGRRAEDLAQRFGTALKDATGRTIETQLKEAIGRTRTASGALNLDVPGLQQALAAQEGLVKEARQLASAYRALDTATAGMSEETRRAARAADALAREETDALGVLRAKLTVTEELQRVLNRQASSAGIAATAAGRFSSANDNAAKSAGALRTATLQAGQQLQDIGISLYSGQRAGVVFAQQLPQLAFALSGLEGSANKAHHRIGRFATFLSGPWGLAVGLGVGVLATLIAKLITTGDEADKTEGAMKDVAFASNAMANAQSILGNVLDLTTGKISTQNQALLALARAQILVAQVQAKTRADEARAAIQALQTPTLRVGGGLGGGFSLERKMPIEGQVSKQMLAGVITPSAAIDKLEQLRELGRITDAQFNAAAASVANLGVELENLKVYEQAEKALEGGGLGPLAKPEKSGRSRKPKGSDEAKKLEQLAESAAEKVQRLNEQFDEAPRLVDRVNQATRELDSIISDLSAKDPIKFRELIEQAKAAKVVVQDALQKPFKDMMETAAEAARIEGFLLQGKTEEAEIQRRIHALVKDQGQVLPAQEAAIRNIVAQERARARLLEIQADMRQRELRYLEETRDNLRQTTHELLSGRGLGSIGGFFKRQLDSVLADMAEAITSSLFDDFFRDEKDRINGISKVEEANAKMAKTSTAATDAIAAMARAANGAATALGGVAANDNSLEAQFDAAFAKATDIVVMGEKSTGKVLKDSLKGVGKQIFGEEGFAKLSGAVKTGMEGAAIGQMTSGIAKSLGLKQSKLGSQLGGAAGMAIGGPLGAAVGGFLGGTVGGLFKKTKSGAANITGAESMSTYGNSGSFKKAASGAAGSVQDGLRAIAEKLGGDVGGFNVTIGQRHGDWRVRTGTGSLKIKKGAKEFDDDQAGAISYAISLAIQQGAITGLRAATQRLLKGGSDVEAQLQKAISFQSVFDELESIKDPVGAAVKSLNREFERLIKIFGEAGASSEEYAQLEELYNIKRADAVQAANDRIIGSLKSFYDQLTVGNDALSLTDRRAAALANYNPLAERVKAGDTTAYDAFQEAATAFLDIQRQISGSQSGYFDLHSEILAITKSAIDSQAAMGSSASNLANPFTSTAMTSSAATTPIVGAIDQQTSELMRAFSGPLNSVNESLQVLIKQAQVARSPGLPLAVGYW